MRTKFLLGALLACSLSFPARAEFPKNWYVEGVRDLLGGNMVSTAIQADGALVLGAQLNSLQRLEAAAVMDAVALDNQQVLLGTSQAGKAVLIDLRNDKSQELLSLPKGMITAVAADKGQLYAASAPDGQLYKGTAKDGLKPFYKGKETYIWDILPVNGKIYFVTGNPGVLYELKGNQAEPLFRSPESNLRVLYHDAKWGLIIGGGSKGVVYQVKGDQTRAIFDSYYDEITAITGNGQGDLFISANREQPDKNQYKSAVFHLNAKGQGMTLFSLDEESAYSLAYRNQTLYVGTGSAGRLYTIDNPLQPERQTLSLVARSAAKQVSAMLPHGDQTLMFGSSPASVEAYQGGYRKDGIYESDVFGTGIPAQWGTLQLNAQIPSGTQVLVSTRSGNTRTPDNTWSDWSQPVTNPQELQISSPRGRFIQLKFELRSGDSKKTPRVNSFEVNFLRDNLAPLLHEVFFLEKGIYFSPHTVGKQEGPRTVELNYQTLDKLRRPRTTDEVYYSLLEERLPPQMRMIQEYKPGMLTLAWDAEDINDDQLRYDVFYQSYGQNEWKPLAQNLMEMVYSFDSSALMDGKYRFRVFVKDDLSNASNSFKIYRDSDLLTIDNTAPQIQNLGAQVNGKNVTIRFEASDTVSPLAYAEYVLDGQKPVLVQSGDQIVDGRKERFQFQLQAPKGPHVLMVRVADRMGNKAARQVSFEVRE